MGQPFEGGGQGVACRQARAPDQNRREAQPVRKGTTIHEWPEAGLVLIVGPADPPSSVRVREGRAVELDGRPDEAFDSIDRFIARHPLGKPSTLPLVGDLWELIERRWRAREYTTPQGMTAISDFRPRG